MYVSSGIPVAPSRRLIPYGINGRPRPHIIAHPLFAAGCADNSRGGVGATSQRERFSPQDAQTIHAEALAQHRSVSGYLLNVLERSIWIEERSQVGLSYTIKIAPPDASEGRTAIHLHCTVEQADGIRKAAKRRLSSIS